MKRIAPLDHSSMQTDCCFRRGQFVVVAWMLTAIGCGQSSDPALDALPWNNSAQAPSMSDAITPVSAAAQLATSPDPRELKFREHVAESCLDDLRRLAADPLATSAVLEANENNWQTREQILQTDQQWRQINGLDDPLVQKYLNNPCADMLRANQRKHPEYVELFFMDNKGCLVAESNKTSDYWQGDEEKWTECYNDGHGIVYVGDVEYDQSTRLFVIQISVPVFGQDGTTIGAMTASVASDRINTMPATR